MSDDYPLTLTIDGALYRCVPDAAMAAGVAYRYDTEAGSGLARLASVSLVRCPSCGSPLRSVAKGELACAGRACSRFWYAALVHEPGKSPMLALLDQRP